MDNAVIVGALLVFIILINLKIHKFEVVDFAQIIEVLVRAAIAIIMMIASGLLFLDVFKGTPV